MACVVAPAGTGKTTLLAQFAHQTSTPCAWYRAERSDRSEAHLLRHVSSALGSVLPDARLDWSSLEEAVASLDGLDGGRVLLLVDDLHELGGTPALRTFDRLLTYRPDRLGVVVAGRRIPDGFNLGRLRVSEDLVELGSDDLRFRSWEVEDLFRDVYGEPLPPEDAAALTRRTEGWAAGLKLFHLATSGRSAAGRHMLLHSLGTSTAMVRDYLARDVLAGMPTALQRFLVRSCVLGRLNGRLCDALLNTTGSERVLSELQRRELFLLPSEDGRSYRYHEALRVHLEVVLVEEVGQAEARGLYQRAGQLLQAAGAIPEALLAYCRGEDWAAAEGLLGADGPELANDGAAWLGRLPRHLVDHDPWLLLATARRHVLNGSWATASEVYRSAERAFGVAAGAAICRHERTMLSAWIEPLPAATRDWSGRLRRATQRQPIAVTDDVGADGSGGTLVTAVTALLGGGVRSAREHAAAVLQDPVAEPMLHALARLVAGVAGWLADDDHARLRLLEAADVCDGLGLDVASRLCRAVLSAADPRGESDVERIRAACEREGDRWGAGVVALVHGLGLLMRERPAVEPLATATDTFTELRASVLAAWAAAGRALGLAASGDPRATDAIAVAAAMVRTATVPGAQVLVRLAMAHLAHTVLGRSEVLVREARNAAAELGIAADLFPVPTVEAAFPPASSAEDAAAIGDLGRRPSVRIRCFGAFELSVDGRPLEESRVRPQVGMLLRILAVHPGQRLHRERLVTALWPDVEPSRGVHRLHVAVSTLRKLLAQSTSGLAVARDGNAYRLAFPDDADADVLAFQQALDGAAAARLTHDAPRETQALRHAIARYTGDLLPEVGPVEWIVEERDRCRTQAGDAAARLAELALAEGCPDQAARICQQGLQIDRYRDPLWRLAIAANDRAGDAVAAARVRADYQAMLDELGVAQVPLPSATGR